MNPLKRFTHLPQPMIFAGMILVSAQFAFIACDSKSTQSISQEDGDPESTASPSRPDYAWTNHMVWIPPGSYQRGSEQGQGDERPVRAIRISGFWMDETEVTNDQFMN